MNKREQQLFEAIVRATLEQLIEAAEADGRPEVSDWIAEHTGVLGD